MRALDFAPDKLLLLAARPSSSPATTAPAPALAPTPAPAPAPVPAADDQSPAAGESPADEDAGAAWAGLAGLREAAGPAGRVLEASAAEWELALRAAAWVLEPPPEAAAQALPVAAAAGRG